MAQRLFPKFFATRLIPQLFYLDPDLFITNLTQDILSQLWMDGCRELGEKIPPDGIAYETVEQGILIRLPRAHYAGEAIALLLTHIPKAGLFALEKMENEGFALTSISTTQEHQLRECLSTADLKHFQKRVKSLT